ncbi:MAG: carboxylesterase family protein [Myxococcales bacterium]|nr:carboxylesterase family protein [Myxococcales bacterium]
MASAQTEIESGLLRGRRSRGVTSFQGIPYAATTAGEGRFLPPRPVSPWPGVRSADTPGPPAPQRAPSVLNSSWFGLGKATPAEDCLCLNVTTPGTSGPGRPVMVWIHGGAFVFGSGASPLYRADSLARCGAVVVTLNYRLGALGFLAAGSEDEFPSSNLGLRDQVAALGWVKRNIGAFGGDPGNVTLFGESAGAMSIAALLAVPTARPLFRRAILQSGAAHHISTLPRARRVADAWFDAAGLSRGDRSGLRKLPIRELLDAQRAVAMRLGFEAGRLPWQPVIDGTFMTEHPYAALGSGALADKQLIVGTNADEWKLFTLGQRKLLKLDDSGLRQRLHAVLRPLPEAPDWVARAESTYGQQVAGRANAPFEAWCAFQRDRVFAQPAIALAQSHACAGGRAYLYRFDWRHPLLRDRLGACHGIEVPFVFGALRRGPFLPLFGAVPGAQRASRAMQRSFVQFAAEGDPSPLVREWSETGSRDDAALAIGGESGMTKHTAPEALRYQQELADRWTSWEERAELEGAA